MANVKITTLPAAGTVVTTDILPIVALSGPTTQKATVADIGTANHPGLNPALIAAKPLDVLRINGAGTAISSSAFIDLPLPIFNLDPAGGSDGDVITRVAGVPVWLAPTGGAGVTGSNTQVMFNFSGTLAGDVGFEYDTASDQLNVRNLKVGLSGTVGSDVVAYFSGTYGLTGSNTARKAVVFLSDYMLSGTFQQQRPSNSPNLHRWNIFTQSITTDATAQVVFSWPMVSGSTCVDAQFSAIRANATQAAVFAQKALFRNSAGVIVEVGTGSISAGSITDAGIT